MRIEIVQSSVSYLWHFRILRDDGGLIATSLAHRSQLAAEVAAKVVLDNINSATITVSDKAEWI